MAAAAISQPRPRSTVLVKDLISDLPMIRDVDDMLREGVSLDDVSNFIQNTMGLLTNVAPQTLARKLQDRRENLPPAVEPVVVEDFPAISEGEAAAPRRPGTLARKQYLKAMQGIDRMIELESLYLSARDRIDWLMEMERTAGAPYEKMSLEYAQAREFLKTHADLEREFGATANRFRRSVDISGRSGSELGQKLQRVLDNPESRHKVVSLVKRMKQAAQLPQHVADVEAETEGG